MSVDVGGFVNVKRMFFDRMSVIRQLDKASWKALGRIGSYVMTSARHSIKQRDDISAPENPPHSHYGAYMKKGILFGFDKESRSVLIGPTLFRDYGKYSDIFEVLEYGGTTTRKGKPAHYRARPFMGPAREAAEPLDRFWANSVT